MPTPTTELDAARAEFQAARDELSKAQEAFKTASTAGNEAARAAAQQRYADAGHNLRLIEDPELDLDVTEFNRHLRAKRRARDERIKGRTSA